MKLVVKIFAVLLCMSLVITLYYFTSNDDGANVSEVVISIFPRDRGSITATMQVPEVYSLVSVHNGNEGARLLVYDDEANSIVVMTVSVPENEPGPFDRLRRGASAFPADTINDKYIWKDL